MKNFRDYLQIKDAAALLGVSPGTLRNWTRQGRVPEHRHPVNGYRLFLKSDLEQLLAAARKPAIRQPGRQAKG